MLQTGYARVPVSLASRRVGGRWAVAALGVATAIPAAAISAVVLTGGSDAAVMQLGSPSGTLHGAPPRSGTPVPADTTVPVAVQAVSPATPPSTTTAFPATAPARTATVAARSDLRTLAPGARVGTADRRLSFVAPQGWVYGLCPQGGTSCVEVAPVALGAGDAIDVLVTEGAPGDSVGDPVAAGSPVVAGRPVQVLDLPSNDSVLVYGPMPTAGQRFMVSCRYDAHEALLRKACDQVLRTLQIA